MCRKFRNWKIEKASFSKVFLKLKMDFKKTLKIDKKNS